MGDKARNQTLLAPELTASPREFFQQAVNEALEQRKVVTLPTVHSYLVHILEHHMVTENLFDQVNSNGKRTRDTLAEIYLKSTNAEPRARMELLRKVGDTALYISGFFGDSLQRKVVDVDYYADMGGAAYATLADCVREAPAQQMYSEFANRFFEFVDVLTYISSNSLAQPEENIMRLYETYAQTGSDLARERLLEKGLIAVPLDTISKKKQ
jgi:hypothetical protein